MSMYVCMYLSMYVCVYVSIYLSIYLSVSNNLIFAFIFDYTCIKHTFTAAEMNSRELCVVKYYVI